MVILRTTLAAMLFVVVAAATAPTRAAEETVEVWKTPTCGCCSLWVDHLRANGFTVLAHDLTDLTMIKRLAGLPDHLQSCHTAQVGGYVIEGHVPAAALRRLLDERPAITGLAVPGMPAGSPGMPSATPERYQVLTFGDGEPEVFATFVGPEED